MHARAYRHLARSLIAALPCLAAAPAGADAPPAPAQAQAAPLDFEGLADAALMASPLTPDSVGCGLALERVVGAARRPLADGGLVLRDDAPARVTVSAVTIRVPGTDQCATNVLLGAYARESFFSASAGWLKSGYVVIWQRTLMVATPAGPHAAAVGGAVGRLAEQMLASWHAQNRPGRAVAQGSDDRSGDDRPGDDK